MGAIRDRVWLRRYGVLPDGGGMLDQSARFVGAVELLDELDARAAAQAEKVAKQRQQALEKQQQRKGRGSRGR